MFICNKTNEISKNIFFSIYLNNLNDNNCVYYWYYNNYVDFVLIYVIDYDKCFSILELFILLMVLINTYIFKKKSDFLFRQIQVA